MHAFEDLSPRKTDFSPTTAYVKETLPGAAVKVGGERWRTLENAGDRRHGFDDLKIMK